MDWTSAERQRLVRLVAMRRRRYAASGDVFGSAALSANDWFHVGCRRVGFVVFEEGRRDMIQRDGGVGGGCDGLQNFDGAPGVSVRARFFNAYPDRDCITVIVLAADLPR